MNATLTRPSGPTKPPVKTAIGYADDGQCEECLNGQPSLRCTKEYGHLDDHATGTALRWSN